MTILEALIQLRDDLKLWCINNFNAKLNKNLGTEESGKVLTVGSDGNISATSIDYLVDGYATEEFVTTKIEEVDLSGYATISYADGLIAALDVSDTAVDGQYVSAVSETNGKIAVSRVSLPDYSGTYAPFSHAHDEYLTSVPDEYITEAEIDALELITTADIDTICGVAT